MKVLFLADLGPALERKQPSDGIQFSDFLPLALALGNVPHGPLLGPTLMATILRNAGHDVELFSWAFRPQRRQALIERLRAGPDVICLSTTFIENRETLRRCVSVIREHGPRVPLVLGGATLLADESTRDLADFCVLGEGEDTLVPLLEAIRCGTRDIRIPGVRYRDESGRVIETRQSWIEDLDCITLPDWSLARSHPDAFYSLETQRGCPNRCAFCNYPALDGYRVRFRTVPGVLRELERNHDLYGIRRYIFTDATFTAPPGRCLELLKGIAQLPFRVEWCAFARVDHLTPELVAAMVSSGCIALFFGLESGDDSILKSMKKGFTTEQARRGLRLLQGTGIRATGSWIVGWPGESPDSVRRTVDLATELKCEQNTVNAFSVSGRSPVDLRPQAFLGKARMSQRQVERWTHWAVLTLLSRGLRLGTFYDLVWLSVIGLGVDEVFDLYGKAQELYTSQLRLHNHAECARRLSPEQMKARELELVARCSEISRRGRVLASRLAAEPERLESVPAPFSWST